MNPASSCVPSLRDAASARPCQLDVILSVLGERVNWPGIDLAATVVPEAANNRAGAVIPWSVRWSVALLALDPHRASRPTPRSPAWSMRQSHMDPSVEGTRSRHRFPRW